MSITQVTPTTVTRPAAAAQGAPASAAAVKPDADGDFDGSKTANDDAVKVTLSDAAIKTLAAQNSGQSA